MSEYNDSLRLDILGVKDELTTDLAADGILFREDSLVMATATYTGADPALGVGGTESITYVEMLPRPKFTRRDVFRTVNGIPMKVGDAVAEVSRAVTREQIESASWFATGTALVQLEDGSGYLRDEGGGYVLGETHDPERFVLVPGEIKQGALTWKVTLRRDFQA